MTGALDAIREAGRRGGGDGERGERGGRWREGDRERGEKERETEREVKSERE